MKGATATEQVFSARRRAMVDGQIRTFDVTDQAVILAFSMVPRELFLPPGLRDLAYSDAVLTLRGASSRAMLQPMHLARLMQGASIQRADRVLVVAGGTGYVACLMAHVAGHVVTLETDAAFAKEVASLSEKIGLANVEAVTGSLAAGHPAGAPYDVILIQGAVEAKLDALFQQLSPTGRLVAIETKTGEATRRAGRAIRFQRVSEDISVRPLFDATAPVLVEFAASENFVF